MSEERIRSVAEVAELAHLREDDPRVVEAMRSPRTRALLLRYREFLAEPAPMPGADFAAADARLAAALERELALPGTTPARRVITTEPREGWLHRLLAPPMRPALAFAALAVVAGVVFVSTRPTPRTGEPVMRGDTTRTMEARILASEPGRVTLQWSAVSGAERYELRFYASDLTERGRVDLGSQTRVELLTGELPAGLVAGEVVFWQAVALRGSDVVQQSATATIRLP